MTLYRWDGKLLVRNGALAIHERCCCDDCDCPDCDVCPYCCLEWSYWSVFWGRCDCPYLSFHFQPAHALSAAQQACHDALTSTTDCTESGGRKGPYWVSDCKWVLPGYWECMVDDGEFGGFTNGFAGCARMTVELKTTTLIELTFDAGFPPVGCAFGDCDPCCTDEYSETIQINITAITEGDEATICTTSRDPKQSFVGGGLEGTNNCVSEVQFDYTQQACCPSTHPDECDAAEEGAGGGGGGDPEGCCDGSETMTEAECDAQEGYWSPDPCEGYP